MYDKINHFNGIELIYIQSMIIEKALNKKYFNPEWVVGARMK